MSKCGECEYFMVTYDGDGFHEEWCEIDGCYLHDNDCPNFKEW